MPTTARIKKNGSEKTGPETSHSSLERATDILVCLGSGINSATEIAAYCDYRISTVHRLLQNLAELNWVVQDGNNHKYYLGPMVNQLSSNHIATHKYLIMHALHDMNHLSEITGETISLVAMVQLRHVLLHEISSTYNLKITQESKMTSPLYAGAVAKTLLSQLDDKELRVTLKYIKYDQPIEKSEINQNKLMSLLKEIRQKGYCVTCGERTPGGLCISAPINNYICPTTLNILGPEDRLKPNVSSYIKELLTSTGRISEGIASVFH